APVYGSITLAGVLLIYNSLVINHAFIIFFTIIPFIIGGFGNFLISLILGSPVLAYPLMNNIRFYSDFSNIDFDSFIIPDVDNRCVLPYKYPIRILRIKIDSIPGLNQTLLFINRPGIFFGQYSDIYDINQT
ncbi:Cytochrome c oxidase subunit 2, partial [Atta colombica]